MGGTLRDLLVPDSRLPKRKREAIRGGPDEEGLGGGG